MCPPAAAQSAAPFLFRTPRRAPNRGPAAESQPQGTATLHRRIPVDKPTSLVCPAPCSFLCPSLCCLSCEGRCSAAAVVAAVSRLLFFQFLPASARQQEAHRQLTHTDKAWSTTSCAKDRSRSMRLPRPRLPPVAIAAAASVRAASSPRPERSAIPPLRPLTRPQRAALQPRRRWRDRADSRRPPACSPRAPSLLAAATAAIATATAAAAAAVEAAGDLHRYSSNSL